MKFFKMGNKQSVSLEDQLIDLKITSKQMIRSSKKCEKMEKTAIEKTKKAIKQGNSEGARIYAQDAIREKNQALNHLKMASRIDAVASRLETAVRMNQVTSAMKGIVKGMETGLAAMDVEAISATMDRFETQFEDLDVKTGYIESTMNVTTATSTPIDQVDNLIQIVADQNNLELGEAFAEIGGPIKKPEAGKVENKPVTDDLESRLANLRS